MNLHKASPYEYLPQRPEKPQQQVTLKINNSYESEPSSGSGSSLSENNASDDEIIRCSHAPNPPSALSVVNSSQESAFRGFGGSPFNKIQKLLSANSKKQGQESLNSSSEVVESKKNVISSGKETFPRFYDVLLENSCNAVDMKLPGVANKTDNNEVRHENKLNTNVAVEDLTFNGKIGILSSTSGQKEEKSTLVSTNYANANVRSPDVFDDETETDHENDNNKDDSAVKPVNGIDKIKEALVKFQAASKKLDRMTLLHWNCRCEREMLRRTRKCLSGVPPPPCMTIPQVDLTVEIAKRKNDILDFFKDITSCGGSTVRPVVSLLKPSHTAEVVKNAPWEDILSMRQLGLSYNLCNASEENDYLQLSVIDRFIGAETASSYQATPSSDKKRQTLQRLKLLTQSPGSRLSHLARRRSVFSSANLASATNSKAFGPQIRIDRPKLVGRRRATPKRATPNSKKKRKTPTSSARKRLSRGDLKQPGPTRETSKRALFQSPSKQQEQLRLPIRKPSVQLKPEIATRLEKSKRALFSPDTSQSSLMSADLNDLSNLMKRKRSATDDDAQSMWQSNKSFRSSQEVITPRSLKIKSQSFCIGSNSTLPSLNASTSSASCTLVKSTSTITSGALNATMGGMKSREMQRAQSDMAMQSNNNLTENQRKKLLWAVSQALQEKKIAVRHENFREYAGVLARVVRRIFQEFYQKTSTSNSETLLRLSKKYVYFVLGGCNADQIYLQAKSQIEESVRISRLRFSGYIGPQEYEERKLAEGKSSSLQNLLIADNSMDSCGMSWTNSSQLNESKNPIEAAAKVGETASSFAKTSIFSENLTRESESEAIAQQQPIQANPALQNSSSKNNLGLVLRENILDAGEQRRSAQKNFNKSPFVGSSAANSSSSVVTNLFGSGCKKTATPQISNNSHVNINCARAKRNISFDS